MDATETEFGPCHEMATDKVLVPTIVVHDRQLEGKTFKVISAQWFGEARRGIPEGAQFFFDLSTDLDHPAWWPGPESFKVVFLGPIKHWPNPNVIDRMVQMMGASPDSTIIWLMSPRGERPGDPSSLMMPVVVLGDPNCGIIKPRLFSDLSVRDEVMKAAEANMSLGDKLARDPRMELPPEEIPWRDSWPDGCRCLKIFEHSHTGKPALPPGGRYHDLSYTCDECGRRWWQYNDYYHLWKHVTNSQEWDAIRREQILKDAGYKPLED